MFYRLEVYGDEGLCMTREDFPDLSKALDHVVLNVNAGGFSSLALYQCAPVKIFSYTNPRRPAE